MPRFFHITITHPRSSVLGNGTESGQGLMVDYRHTDSGQTNPLDFSEHMLKSDTEKIGKYNAAVSGSGHRFMPIIAGISKPKTRLEDR